ncbi:MAG: RMD1 family protein [Bdellovibrionia bacterium]
MATGSSVLYPIKAIHIAEKLKLKDLRERFSQRPAEFSNYEMIVRYSADSFMFVYNYGAVVFFNVKEDLQEKELSAISEYRSSTSQSRATDVFLLEVQEGSVVSTDASVGSTLVHSSQVGSASLNKVYFDRVVVHFLSFEIVKIVCMLLAESTSLEYYEILIENLLVQINAFSKTLRKQGRMLESTEDLIKFIGLCMDTKQEIISNLYIVDSPDETWESVELDKMHQDLKGMMEIDTRYRALEYKIKIIQESIEVIVDLSKSKRETLLEMVIILLITFEIIISIIKWH